MEQHEKIIQLLRSNDERNVELGLQLIRGCGDATIVAQILSKVYISYQLIVPLAQILNERKELWDLIKDDLRDYQRKDLEHWIGREIIAYNISQDLQEFCTFANQHAKENALKMPLLSPQILTKKIVSSDCTYKAGEELAVDGTGWTMKILAEDNGPAETSSKEEWKAIAHHANGRTIYVYDYIEKILWVEIDCNTNP